ncbi:ABC transporter ATP-binding protein [Paenibacillus sp. PL91]|uniref:ABC transporter ATP-binding protein n=1 Tax=Paenibacillus sp. PL91 TaxID=2729538 RepID=UPI00145C71B9|nr:ABC transporter ATP-binding protein [Paenibacillus sp. PL91]MBC9201353.1 ABC transporter ATP-binding protein [Paenibacillus sp. PL91]
MITLTDISKLYRNGAVEVTAIKQISLHIKKGEFVSIMGPSGSGKSTLMNIIGCLDTQDSGSYELDGIQIESLQEKELDKVRNQKIGFVFQSFNLLPKQTILRNVELPMIYGLYSRKDRIERAKVLLDKVGLGERIKNRPNELSGGQRQRVAVARALAMNPSILLADEPTGNLDTASAADIMQLFSQLNEEGTTVILVTHDPHIADYGTRIVLFGDGEIRSDVRQER